MSALYDRARMAHDLAALAPSRPARVTSNERITNCTRGQGGAAGEGDHAR